DLNKAEYYREIFRLLIKFLSDQDIPHVSQDELNSEESRKHIWDSYGKFYDVDMYADAEKLVKALEAIESRYTRRLLPCLYETYTYRQQNLLVNQEEIINKVNDK